ncbi:unnamed protein product [Pleuronectes platessa]|uniref:Uncharacterized protein n=1 Tax=Pleuronectes platessa TaxID=8262 RepID=A0A9N7VKY5_PLEPL|nr:unnamed protein product [Pleuronectes platessa]
MEEDRGGGGGLHKPRHLHVYLLQDRCGRMAPRPELKPEHPSGMDTTHPPPIYYVNPLNPEVHFAKAKDGWERLCEEACSVVEHISSPHEINSGQGGESRLDSGKSISVRAVRHREKKPVPKIAPERRSLNTGSDNNEERRDEWEAEIALSLLSR